MARRGRKRVVEREARYWQLLAQGVGTVEACRQLEIGRTTGYRWRAELGGIRPLTRPPNAAPSSGRYLSRFDRQRIATPATQGVSVREIARRIGRAASTVSRELRRNRVDGEAMYDADLALALAQARTRRPKTPRLMPAGETSTPVQQPIPTPAGMLVNAPAPPSLPASCTRRSYRITGRRRPAACGPRRRLRCASTDRAWASR
jgi:IS30 family transposase